VEESALRGESLEMTVLPSVTVLQLRAQGFAENSGPASCLWQQHTTFFRQQLISFAVTDWTVSATNEEKEKSRDRQTVTARRAQWCLLSIPLGRRIARRGLRLLAYGCRLRNADLLPFASVA